MIEQVIYSVLKNDANVSGVTTSIYNHAIPQGVAWPAITYMRISNEPQDTKSGVSGTDNIMLDVDLWGDNYATLKTLAGHVRTALDRYAGTVSGVEVKSIQFQTDREDYEMGDSEIIYHISQEYKVRHKRD